MTYGDLPTDMRSHIGACDATKDVGSDCEQSPAKCLCWCHADQRTNPDDCYRCGRSWEKHSGDFGHDYAVGEPVAKGANDALSSHADDRLDRVPPHARAHVQSAIDRFARHNKSGSSAALVWAQGQHHGPSDANVDDRNESNGEHFWAVSRDGVVPTAFWRRKDQPATREALRVDKVFTKQFRAVVPVMKAGRSRDAHIWRDILASKCECEHQDHFDEPRSHAYGESGVRANDFQTPFGTFKLCGNCREAGHMDLGKGGNTARTRAAVRGFKQHMEENNTCECGERAFATAEGYKCGGCADAVTACSCIKKGIDPRPKLARVGGPNVLGSTTIRRKLGRIGGPPALKKSRCEDFPACGHGPEPYGDDGGCPDAEGRYDCVLCGDKLGRGVTSSICKPCKNDRGRYEQRDDLERSQSGISGYIALQKAYQIEKQGDTSAVRNTRRTMTTTAKTVNFTPGPSRAKPDKTSITWERGTGTLNVHQEPSHGGFLGHLTESTQKRIARIQKGSGKHDWQYDNEGGGDRFICSTCTATTFDPNAFPNDCAKGKKNTRKMKCQFGHIADYDAKDRSPSCTTCGADGADVGAYPMKKSILCHACQDGDHGHSSQMVDMPGTFQGRLGHDDFCHCDKPTSHGICNGCEKHNGVPVHTFDSSGDAYSATQTDDEIKDGHLLHVPSEKVVGVAHTWPVAVTKDAGDLHRLKKPLHEFGSRFAHGAAYAKKQGYELAEGGDKIAKAVTSTTESTPPAGMKIKRGLKCTNCEKSGGFVYIARQNGDAGKILCPDCYHARSGVKKSVPAGTRPFARRAMPKTDVKEARAKSPRYGMKKGEESVSDALDRKDAWRRQGDWHPASGGTETPFKARSGKRLLYVHQPRSGRHAYLDLDSDIVLSDAEAEAHMNPAIAKSCADCGTHSAEVVLDSDGSPMLCRDCAGRATTGDPRRMKKGSIYLAMTPASKGLQKSLQAWPKCPGCNKVTDMLGMMDHKNPVCMKCVTARARTAGHGRCKCGRLANPGKPTDNGQRQWVPCRRCLGHFQSLNDVCSKCSSRAHDWAGHLSPPA